jgi:hypothetical protein
MRTREIPAVEWTAFLQQFSAEHRAWLASVDRVRPGASRHVEVVERPLGSVTASVAARRVVGIQIQFQEDSNAGGAIRIERPKRLRVEETEEGAVRALEIEDESGQSTRVGFRVTARPEALDGIAPGEL